MSKETWPPCCEGCGEFMSYRQLSRSIQYTSFGDSYDTEPPEPQYYHRKCWRKLNKYWKNLIKNISWVAPYDNLKKKRVKYESIS